MQKPARGKGVLGESPPVVKKYNTLTSCVFLGFLILLSNDEILVLETKGEENQKDKVKPEALREWILAVNQHGGFGHWHAESAVSKHPDDIPEILERVVTKK